MRPTVRGVSLAGLCGLAFWLAATFGARSLNAFVVPAFVALVAAVVQLLLADRPTVHRNRPEAGFPGDSRPVRIDVETDDPLTARITEHVGDGVRADVSSLVRGLPTTIEYDVSLERRGEHRLGPLTLRVQDVFGLATRAFEYPKRTPVLVYPELHDIAGATGVFGGPADVFDEREAFDELREYVHGDSLRDVHWKTSAKRDALVVMEFDSDAEARGLTIAAEAAPGYADEMASAAASVAAYLLDAGLAVGLVYPDGHVERAGGDPQRERILSALARTHHGRSEATDADIRVSADAEGTRVAVEGREVPFDRVVGTPSHAVADGGVSR